MPDPSQIVSALVLGLPLWIAGVHFFDGVHWVLHLMMNSRSRLARLLSRPHLMHHRWLDERLSTRWEYQHRNLWGHIVLEYVTQLAFSAALLLYLPTAPVLGCILYQTLLFSYILSQRGLDVNHRAIEMLDAYRPSVLALPAYHALHHAYPDAYFSAYSKLVDYVIGGGITLQRRLALLGAGGPFGEALRQELEGAGVRSFGELETPDPAALAEMDVVVICDPEIDRVTWIEGFIEATRRRQLPPEVWAVQAGVEDAVARAYYRDLRVSYRAIRVGPDALVDAAEAKRAARRAFLRIRRGFNFVPTGGVLVGLAEFRRFRMTRPQKTADVDPRTRRIDLRQAA